MRVYLVGATGVLGRALIPRLLDAGHTSRVMTRRMTRDLARPGVEAMPGDLLDPALDEYLRSLLGGCDAACHLATAIPSDPTRPDAWTVTARLRTEGTQRLLEAAIAAGVTRYVQQSVSMAYPDCGDVWIDETAPLDDSVPRSEICGPVIAMERMVRGASERIETCILRGGRFVGPGTFEELLIEQIRGRAATVPGSGRNWVSHVDVKSMADAVRLAIERAPAGSVYNVNRRPERYGEYVDRLALSVGAGPPPRSFQARSWPSHRCSSQKIRQQLGWRPGDDERG